MNHESPEAEIADLLRQIQRQDLHLLRFRDREMGLEQELATARSGSNQQALLTEIAVLRSSISFRLGRTLTAPFRGLGYLFSRAKGLFRRFARKLADWLRNRVSSK